MATSSIGTASRNYSTIAAWITAISPVPTGGQTGQCYNDSEFLITSTIDFSGLTTTAINDVVLTTATGQSAFDTNTNGIGYNQSNGVGIRSTTSYFIMLKPINYLTISKIQFSNQGSGNDNRCVDGSTVSTSTGGFQVSQCLLEVTTANGSGCWPLGILGGGSAFNTFLICGGTTSTGVRAQYFSSGAVVLANVIIARTSNNTATGTAIVTSGAGAPVLINTGIFNFSSISSGTTPTGSNNATDLSSMGFGTSNQVSLPYANQFVTTTLSSRNFRTKTGANLIDNGATDTTDIPAAIDIFGTSRPQGSAWDIGAHELITSAPVTLFSATLAMMGVG